MRVIGYIKAYLPTTGENTRNTEGSFIRLKDGSILYAYSHFGANGEDGGASDIGSIRSYDEGETWVERKILLARQGNDNIMCPSLMRMQNGDLGMFYHHRPAPSAGICFGREFLVRSSDEGEHWSEPVLCSPDNETFNMENGHAIRLNSGRILLPFAFHATEIGAYCDIAMYAKMAFTVSDDDGVTWREVSERPAGPPPEWTGSGLQETMAFQCDDGSIRAFARTDLLCQYESDSFDDGETWTMPQPNRHFSSPCSPMMIKRVGTCFAAVYNPIPMYFTRDTDKDDRSPLIIRFSEDGGKTFGNDKAWILDDRGHCCYPEIFDGGSYCLVAYQALNDGVIRKISDWEFDRGWSPFPGI